MISYVQPLPVGNAIRLFLTPPAGAAAVRVLRRTADTFTGASDAGAVLVAETLDNAVLDALALVNGVAYFYKPYALIGGVWKAGDTVSGTPAATYADASFDVVGALRDRLALGLAVEVQRGLLQHELGKIPVLIGSPTFEDTKWPVVTIHVGADSSDGRFLGEAIEPDQYIGVDDEWVGTEGWLSRVQLNVAGWALNSDVRAALRRAVKRIIIANLPVFEAAGMYQIGITQQDIDDFQTYSAPVYQSICQFTCLARSSVTSVDGPIGDIIVNPPVFVTGP